MKIKPQDGILRHIGLMIVTLLLTGALFGSLSLLWEITTSIWKDYHTGIAYGPSPFLWVALITSLVILLIINACGVLSLGVFTAYLLYALGSTITHRLGKNHIESLPHAIGTTLFVGILVGTGLMLASQTIQSPQSFSGFQKTLGVLTPFGVLIMGILWLVTVLEIRVHQKKKDIT